MIYAIARFNIYAILPVENLPSRTSGSTDWVERSILIEKTERAYFAKLATQAKSDTTNLQFSIVNIQFRLVRVGIFSYFRPRHSV